MYRTRMDINCDMGESFGNWVMGDDIGMMPYITTANVACGFHASDPLTMLNTVRQAKEKNVEVGAHPGLPDLLGFGRRAMNITPDDAHAYVIYQVGALEAALRCNQMTLHHVKPHGAFYSILRVDEKLAAAVVDALLQISDAPVLYWPSPTDAALPSEADKRGIRVIGEIYPDLAYASDGSLILQRSKDVTDVDFACNQVKRFVEDGNVETQDGELIALNAESICIHGDGPNCVEIASAICRTLEGLNCQIKPATL